MNKCNNCVKFLTCDGRKRDQVTFLQAKQLDKLDKLEVKEKKK